MDIALGLSIHERTCYACIAHPDLKASEQEEGEKKFTSRPVSLTPVKIDRLKVLWAYNTYTYRRRCQRWEEMAAR